MLQSMFPVLNFEKVSIYNSSGLQVKIAYNNEVDISNLDSGVYFVKTTFGNGGTSIEKLVKY